MIKKKYAGAVFLGLIILALNGCGSSSDASSTETESAGSASAADSDDSQADADSPDTVSGFVTASTDDDGNIVITKSQIGTDAAFINYDADGVTVQIIAVRASDDSVRLAYNTCQTCNPSPNAYFVQDGDAFTCQNCGNQFQTDEVGLSASGCNPTTVDGVTETDDTITIDKSSVETMASRFESWGGPVE